MTSAFIFLCDIVFDAERVLQFVVYHFIWAACDGNASTSWRHGNIALIILTLLSTFQLGAEHVGVKK